MIASDYDIKYTNNALHYFSKNLDWDLGFILKLISSDFYKLNDISVSKKKELLVEIGNLILKYQEMPSSQKIVEEY